jgi:Ca2+-binding EF-hand superfamily protein
MVQRAEKRYKVHKPGSLDFGEFELLFRQQVMADDARKAMGEGERQGMEAVFNRYDTNGDGVLDTSELTKYLHEVCKGDQPTTVEIRRLLENVVERPGRHWEGSKNRTSLSSHHFGGEGGGGGGGGGHRGGRNAASVSSGQAFARSPGGRPQVGGGGGNLTDAGRSSSASVRGEGLMADGKAIDFDQFVLVHSHFVKRRKALAPVAAMNPERKARLKKLFDRYDVKHPGLLSGSGSGSDRGNGTLSVSQLLTLLQQAGSRPTKQEVEALVADVDVDGDGLLDFEEFCLLSLRQEAVESKL